MYVGVGNQKIFSATFTVVNSFVYFTLDEQQANWIFAQFGRTHSDKVQRFPPIYGMQLTCDCGQSMCHAELGNLICELVTSGAMFLLRHVAEIPLRMVQVLHRVCFLNIVGSIGVFGLCFQTI